MAADPWLRYTDTGAGFSGDAWERYRDDYNGPRPIGMAAATPAALAADQKRKLVQAQQQMGTDLAVSHQAPEASLFTRLGGSLKGLKGSDVMAMISRVGGGLAGGVLGGLASSPTVLGIPAGVMAGTVAGGAAGEALAQKIEGRQDINLGQVGMQGAINAIPFGGAAKGAGLLRRVLTAGAKGALVNTGASVGTSLAEGEMPDVGNMKLAAYLGFAGGGALGGLLPSHESTAPPGKRPSSAPISAVADESAVQRRADYFARKNNPDAPLAVPGMSRTGTYDTHAVDTNRVVRGGSSTMNARGEAVPIAEPKGNLLQRLSSWNAQKDAPRVAAGQVADRAGRPLSPLQAGQEEVLGPFNQGRAPETEFDFYPGHGRGTGEGMPPLEGLDPTWTDAPPAPFTATNQGRNARELELRPGRGRGTGQTGVPLADVPAEFGPEWTDAPGRPMGPGNQGQSRPDIELRPGRGRGTGQADGAPVAGEWTDVPLGPGNQGLSRPDVELRPGRGRGPTGPDGPVGPSNGAGGDWGDLEAVSLVDRLRALGKGPRPGRAPALPLGEPRAAAGTGVDDLMAQLGLEGGGGQLDIMDPHLATLNGSGESGASMEALSRQRSMQSQGQSYVVYDRMGNKRPILGPDAVDYNPRPGETYGIEGPRGFQLLTDNGGRAPQSILPGSAIPPADMLPPGAASPLEQNLADAGVTNAIGSDQGAVRLNENGVPKGKIPAPFVALMQRLGSGWENTLAKTGVDMREGAVAMAHRIAAEENPRNLMGAERKLVKELRDQGLLPSAAEIRATYGPPPDATPPGAKLAKAKKSPAIEALAPQQADTAPSGPVAALGEPPAPPKKLRALRPHEKEHFDALYDDAVAQGYKGPKNALKALYTEQADNALGYAQDMAASSPQASGRELLEAVRAAGGIGVDAERSFKGEVRTLLEDVSKQGRTKAGKVMPSRSGGVGGIAGIIKGEGGGGQPLDRIREALVEAGIGGERYDDLSVLVDDIREAIREVRGTSGKKRAIDSLVAQHQLDAIENGAGIRKGVPWWQDDAGGPTPGGATPGDGGEAGFVAPQALLPMATTLAGAAAGPVMFDDEDPAVAALGGAGLGLMGGLAGSKGGRRLLERGRYSNLLSGTAVPKSMLGNLGALAAYAAETGQGRNVAREFFSPETMRAVKESWAEAPMRETVAGGNAGPLALPGRVMGTFDAATRSTLQRAGATADQAEEMVLMNRPRTESGQDLQNLVNRGDWMSGLARQVLPFSRTATNAIERGAERLPFIGGMEPIRAMTGASPELARRRQILGALSMLGAGGVGYATGEGGPLEDYGTLGAYGTAAMGPYALPGVVAGAIGRTLSSEDRSAYGLANAASSALTDLLPIPREYSLRPGRYLRSFLPFGSLGRTVAPVNPDELDTSGSLFAPAISQVPFLNDAVLNRRATATR